MEHSAERVQGPCAAENSKQGVWGEEQGCHLLDFPGLVPRFAVVEWVPFHIWSLRRSSDSSSYVASCTALHNPANTGRTVLHCWMHATLQELSTSAWMLHHTNDVSVGSCCAPYACPLAWMARCVNAHVPELLAAAGVAAFFLRGRLQCTEVSLMCPAGRQSDCVAAEM